ncbi:hypothetical protein M422DRAFT_88702, partial [Sphaerobolus stellatus SS14]
MTGRTPTEEWVRRFFKKVKGIEMATVLGLDPKRAKAFSCENISHFFELYKETVTSLDIPPTNIFHFDEKGLQLGGGRKNIRTKYIFATEHINRYVKKSDSLVLVTILECISAVGEICPSGFVLPQGPVCDFSDIEGVGCVATSENGWTDNFICGEWFTKVFIPWAKEVSNPTFPIIFISDGHGSHETHKMLLAALDNDIIMISLPLHTTHKMQPLDVGVFGPLQIELGKQCNDLAITGTEVSCDTVIQEYMAIRATHMKPKAIKSAFRHTGLCSFNVDIFTDEDFAPALFFTNKPTRPDGYPEHVNTSDESAASTHCHQSSAEEDWGDDVSEDEDYRPHSEPEHD